MLQCWMVLEIQFKQVKQGNIFDFCIIENK